MNDWTVLSPRDVTLTGSCTLGHSGSDNNRNEWDIPLEAHHQLHLTFELDIYIYMCVCVCECVCVSVSVCVCVCAFKHWSKWQHWQDKDKENTKH